MTYLTLDKLPKKVLSRIDLQTAFAASRCIIAAERLRLLYVGITRAKKELVITWNSGRSQSQRPPNQQATPFIALSTWWSTHTPDED